MGRGGLGDRIRDGGASSRPTNTDALAWERDVSDLGDDTGADRADAVDRLDRLCFDRFEVPVNTARRGDRGRADQAEDCRILNGTPSSSPSSWRLPPALNMSVCLGSTPSLAITACTCALSPLRSCTSLAR